MAHLDKTREDPTDYGLKAKIQEQAASRTPIACTRNPGRPQSIAIAIIIKQEERGPAESQSHIKNKAAKLNDTLKAGHYAIHGNNRPRKVPERLHQKQKHGPWMPSSTCICWKKSWDLDRSPPKGRRQHSRTNKESNRKKRRRKIQQQHEKEQFMLLNLVKILYFLVLSQFYILSYNFVLL